jgi:hypothetical protein
MSRQDDVVQTLLEGFKGIREVRKHIDNEGVIRLEVANVQDFLVINTDGSVQFPEGIDPVLAYWISIDLECLDLKEK